MRYAATVVELLGTLVTAYGLAVAFGRTTGLLGRLRGRLRAFWLRITRQRHDIDIRPHGIGSTLAGGIPTVEVHHPFQLDENTSVQLQLRQLANCVRELRQMFPPIITRIAELDAAIEHTKVRADTAAARALAEAKAEIDRFGKQLDQLQAADLTIAVVGVLITAVGIVLSFWA
jgi:hypothetical protein